jgi:hypothetical protein
VDYLVTPPAATAWGFEPDELAAALRERWPGAEVRQVPAGDPAYAIDFTLDEGGRRIDGALGREGQTLGLTGDLEAAMAVAAWFRAQVPDAEPLQFYDPALNGQVALTPGIDPAAAVEAYRAGDRP